MAAAGCSMRSIKTRPRPPPSAMSRMPAMIWGELRPCMMRIWLKRFSKSSPRRGFRPIPERDTSCCAAGGTPPSSSAFRMSLRASGLPVAFRTVNMRCARSMPVVDTDHHVAVVEQEIGEAAALIGVEIPQSLMQVLANLDHPRFVRRRVVADRCDARSRPRAHMASEERFVAFPQRQPRPGIATLPGADRGQQALMRFPASFASRSRRTQKRMVSVVRRWRPSTTSKTRVWRENGRRKARSASMNSMVPRKYSSISLPSPFPSMAAVRSSSRRPLLAVPTKRGAGRAVC